MENGILLMPIRYIFYTYFVPIRHHEALRYTELCVRAVGRNSVAYYAA
jgi:hypothetical protein